MLFITNLLTTNTVSYLRDQKSIEIKPNRGANVQKECRDKTLRVYKETGIKLDPTKAP